MAFDVLADLGLEDIASRPINQLSGGQNQMVSIAQSLVKGPKMLLMDEPTSNLDLRRQLEIFDLVREVTSERKIITLVALHDLNLAALYADSVIVLKTGRIHVAGGPKETLTPEMISSVYGVRSEVYTDDEGLPVVVPNGSVKRRRRKRQDAARSTAASAARPGGRIRGGHSWRSAPGARGRWRGRWRGRRAHRNSQGGSGVRPAVGVAPGNRADSQARFRRRARGPKAAHSSSAGSFEIQASRPPFPGS